MGSRRPASKKLNIKACALWASAEEQHEASCLLEEMDETISRLETLLEQKTILARKEKQTPGPSQEGNYPTDDTWQRKKKSYLHGRPRLETASHPMLSCPLLIGVMQVASASVSNFCYFEPNSSELNPIFFGRGMRNDHLGVGNNGL